MVASKRYLLPIANCQQGFAFLVSSFELSLTIDDYSTLGLYKLRIRANRHRTPNLKLGTRNSKLRLCPLLMTL